METVTASAPAEPSVADLVVALKNARWLTAKQAAAELVKGEVQVLNVNLGGEDGGLDEVVTAVLGASWLLVGISSRSLEDIDDRVTLAQFRTMAVLAQRRQSNLSRLAAELAVNVSTAMRMVNRLVAAGLMSRSENPQTRREVVLCLTAEGEQLVRGVLSRRRTEIARLLAQMPGGSHDALAAGLRTFIEAAWSAGARPVVPGALVW